MKITIIGTGYVGLVTGACFAEMGNSVTCVDVDKAKIEGLKQGKLPIYEPGLEHMVVENQAQGRLTFASSLDETQPGCKVFFIAVGTPPDEDGRADLSHVLSAARDLGRHITDYCVIVDKSTVPVGTAEKVAGAMAGELASRGLEIEFEVISNPEFLKEGAAVADFMKPDRVIIGNGSERARQIMHDLYSPFTRSRERMLFVSNRAAELIKYASNAMLATRISFMNELSVLCDSLGVDVEDVRVGIGSDSRIGYSFIYPGCGYGGSCFPKDMKALIKMAWEAGIDPVVLRSVEERNESQKRALFRKIKGHFGDDLKGKAFCLWGLAFKPGTDDMREAPSVVLIDELIRAGARVTAFDPVATEVARRQLPSEWLSSGSLKLAEDMYAALEGADAMVLVTEWKAFRNPDFERMLNIMNTPAVFDGRNLYDPGQMAGLGFEYFGIGR